MNSMLKSEVLQLDDCFAEDPKSSKPHEVEIKGHTSGGVVLCALIMGNAFVLVNPSITSIARKLFNCQGSTTNIANNNPADSCGTVCRSKRSYLRSMPNLCLSNTRNAFALCLSIAGILSFALLSLGLSACVALFLLWGWKVLQNTAC